MKNKFTQIKNKYKHSISKTTIKVGLSSCGIAAGAKEIFDLLQQEIKKQSLDIELKRCGCVGMCYAEPLVEVHVKGMPQVTYGRVDKNVALDIINLHINKKQLLEDYIYRIKSDKPLKLKRKIDNKAFDKQVRFVLRNCGIIDPENIEDYIAAGGYEGFLNVLDSSNDKIIEELKSSGLRGRGGGGFPTWMKWKFAKDIDEDEKYIICNGDEGDPGAYMDRSILEGDPHSVLEGMMIAAFCVGAKKGFLYIRAEYPLAIERIQKAIDQAYSLGLLGKNILNCGFNFDLDIRLGAGAFVCGEETALIASIEGKRGCPSPRPPYPSIKGLWGKPTVINNVETLANVSFIFLNGAKKFSRLGSATSKGTKVFALTGRVKNSGLVEVPMGTTIREIVFDIGGGLINDKKIKAVQTGGPSGGVIPEEFLDTGVDYENLQRLGSIMGSGGMIVMDEDDCMVDIAKFYMRFCVDESCGKCAPCRIGTYQMLEILKQISKGRATRSDIEKLELICKATQKASLCGLGQTAPNPVISTLKYFKEEYIEHINEKKCRSKKCLALLNYSIVKENCKKCGICALNCPVKAIIGDPSKGFVIDKEKCIKCGKCFEVCKFDAIIRE
ncbi:MAG: NADH-quinone oxidoreductase subunit NuoF [Candidatus Gygaella obscura]|nr:NADH-quinone oxidoreductase subunit NuoF [Candidatus Gygaella obscura]